MRVHISTGKQLGFWIIIDRKPQWTLREVYPIAGRVPKVTDMIGKTWPVYLDLKAELLRRVESCTDLTSQEDWPLTVVNLPQSIIDQISAEGDLKSATFHKSARNNNAYVACVGMTADEAIKVPAGTWSWVLPPTSD